MTWASFEATWLNHAKSWQFERDCTEALQTIDDAMLRSDVRWYAGMSGGKDSIALAWLLSRHRSARGVRLAHAASELLTPGMTDCAEAAAKTLGFGVDVMDPEFDGHEDVWGFMRSIAHLSREMACKVLFRACASANMLVAYQYQAGLTGAFSGMRTEESRGRRFNAAVRGELYRVKSDGTWMCNPISSWKARSVWAAVLASGCRYPEHYRRLYERFAVSPESPQSRVDSLVVSERVSAFNGAMATTRVLYPQLWRKIQAAAPCLAQQ